MKQGSRLEAHRKGWATQHLPLGLLWPILSPYLPGRTWEYHISDQVSKLDPHKSMGQERMYPRVWREVAKVIARTALHLLQKVLGIRRGSWRLASYMYIGMKADLGNYLLIELSSVSTRILEKTLVKTMYSHMEDKKVIWDSMDSQTTNGGWTVWVLALRRWLAWWIKEVIYLSFCKACCMVFLQPNWWDVNSSSGLQGECTIGHIMRFETLWSAVKSPIDEWFLVTSIRNQH